MIKNKRWALLIVLIPILFMFIKFGAAQIRSIANYLTCKDVVDMGGAPSQSTHYMLLDAIGQSGGIGEATSANYHEASGFIYGECAAATTPVLVVSPTVLDFGTSQTTMTFVISNGGSGTLTWTVTETPDKPWIVSVTPVSGSGASTITVNVDRSLLSGNSDSGTLAVTSNGGNINVTILISKPPVGGIVISAPNTAGSPGSTVDIPISVTDLTGKNVLSLTLVIETQTSVLTPIAVTTTGTLLDGWGSVTTNIVGGQISLSAANVSALSGSGTLIFIRYQVNSAATIGQTSAIHFVSAILNEGDPVVTTQDGQFTISSGYNVSGAIRYHQNSNAVDNATVTLTGHTTTTAADGSFSFSSIAGGNLTLTPAKTGDIGSSISAFDASMILRYSVGIITLTPYQLIAADVSGNGSVSAYDASYVLRYTVGLISAFPVGADWIFVPNSFAINTSNWNAAPHSISYSPLNSNQTNQDFTGIVCGDVTGNWTLMSMAKNLIGSAVIGFGDIVHISPSEFYIPVTSKATGHVYSTKIEVGFDDEMIDFQEVILSDKLQNCSEFHNIKSNHLTIALAGINDISSADDLLSIKFKAKNPEERRSTTLSLIDATINENQISVIIQNGDVSLKPALPTTHQLEQNIPNPFNPTTTIYYNLEKSSRVTLVIYDVLGHHIKTLIDAQQPAGHWQTIWDGKNDAHIPVAAGVYFCRMQAGKFSKVIKLTLVK